MGLIFSSPFSVNVISMLLMLYFLFEWGPKIIIRDLCTIVIFHQQTRCFRLAVHNCMDFSFFWAGELYHTQLGNFFFMIYSSLKNVWRDRSNNTWVPGSIGYWNTWIDSIYIYISRTNSWRTVTLLLYYNCCLIDTLYMTFKWKGYSGVSIIGCVPIRVPLRYYRSIKG